jgi:hypothetical protein
MLLLKGEGAMRKVMMIGWSNKRVGKGKSEG